MDYLGVSAVVATLVGAPFKRTPVLILITLAPLLLACLFLRQCISRFHTCTQAFVDKLLWTTICDLIGLQFGCRVLT